MENILNLVVTRGAVLALAVIVFQPLHVSADTNVAKAKKSLASIRVEIKKLKLLLKKTGVRAGLAKASLRPATLKDSDGDGLPDILENIEGSNTCDSDTDRDGIVDGDEAQCGSRTNDPDQACIELRGQVSAVSSTTVTVGDHTFTATENTIFRHVTSLAEVTVGDKVEILGRIVDSVLTLRKLEVEDEDGRNDEDEPGDDHGHHGGHEPTPNSGDDT